MQGFSCFRSIIIWFEGKYTWLGLLITSWVFRMKWVCPTCSVEILTQPEAYWCRYPMGEWVWSGTDKYLIISWVKEVYGQVAQSGKLDCTDSSALLSSGTWFWFCDSWRICLAPLSSRQRSIIICFGKDNAESDRKEGRECNLGTALHFFSSETKEHWGCGGIREAEMMKVSFYYLIFILSSSGWQSDAMMV